MISLSQKQSNAWHYLEDDKTTEVVYGGGAGGGKSYLGCIWHITRRTTYPGTRGVIGRAKISNIEQSTLVTLFKVAAEMGYRQGIDYIYNSQKHIITWKNGSQTILKDLFLYPSDPDFISLGSTEYTDAFIDEATEVTLKAFEILNSRIRWMLREYSLRPKILLTCNPSPGWIKERYISNKGKIVTLKDDQKFVRSLLSDNPDHGFKELYNSQLTKMVSEYDRARLLHGDWEVSPDVKNPFLPQYDPLKHESIEAALHPQRQLYISMDFNINPFAINIYQMWQDFEGFHCHQVGEKSIEDGNIVKAVAFIKDEYGQFINTLKLTGDYSGTRKSIEMSDNASLFTQIQRGLNLRDSQVVLVPNPLHENSRADANYFLYNFHDFKINPNTCPDTCRDMRTVQCDAYGKIIKRNRGDISQQSDHLDAFRYFVNSFMYDWIQKHQKGWYQQERF